MAFRKKTKKKPTQPVKSVSESDDQQEDDALTPEIVESSDESEELDAEFSEPDDSDLTEEEILQSLDSSNESSSNQLAATDAMGRYMAEVAKYPVLSREEEHELAVRYKETGDPKAAEALVTANLRFVVKVAAEYTKFGSKLIDLVQEGNVGLMHAVKEFNPYKGVRLITYAVWWIRGYIQEYLMRQYSMVRIGTTANQRKLFYQLQKQKQELEKLGYREGIAQLSGKLGIPEDEVESMHQRLTGRDVSLDQPVKAGESSSTLLDFQSEEVDDSLVELIGTVEEIELLQQKIDEIRPDLNDRELEILDHRLLTDSPVTLQEIGEKHGVSREAVRQMEVRVMKKIKAAIEDEIKGRLDHDPEG